MPQVGLQVELALFCISSYACKAGCLRRITERSCNRLLEHLTCGRNGGSLKQLLRQHHREATNKLCLFSSTTSCTIHKTSEVPHAEHTIFPCRTVWKYQDKQGVWLRWEPHPLLLPSHHLYVNRSTCKLEDGGELYNPFVCCRWSQAVRQNLQ